MKNLRKTQTQISSTNNVVDHLIKGRLFKVSLFLIVSILSSLIFFNFNYKNCYAETKSYSVNSTYSNFYPSYESNSIASFACPWNYIYFNNTSFQYDYVFICYFSGYYSLVFSNAYTSTSGKFLGYKSSTGWFYSSNGLNNTSNYTTNINVTRLDIDVENSSIYRADNINVSYLQTLLNYNFTQLPTSVQLSTPTLSRTNYGLSWTTISNATYYQLQYQSSDGSSWISYNSTLTSTSFEVPESLLGKTWRVRAIGDGSSYTDSEWSNTLEFQYYILGTPTISFYSGYPKTRVTWTNVTNADLYQIQRYYNDEWNVEDSISSNTFDLALESDLSVYYPIRIVALKSGIQSTYRYSNYSNSLTYSNVVLPTPELTITNNKLKWDVVDYADVYYIYQYVNSDWILFNTIYPDHPQGSITISTLLQAGTQYKIVAHDNDGIYNDSTSNTVTYTGVNTESESNVTQLPTPVVSFNTNMFIFDTSNLSNYLSYIKNVAVYLDGKLYDYIGVTNEFTGSSDLSSYIVDSYGNYQFQYISNNSSYSNSALSVAVDIDSDTYEIVTDGNSITYDNSKNKALENDLFENFTDKLSDIADGLSNNLNSFGSKFLSSATFVSNQFDSMTNNNPFGSVVKYSLMLGIALLIIGRGIIR